MSDTSLPRKILSLNFSKKSTGNTSCPTNSDTASSENLSHEQPSPQDQRQLAYERKQQALDWLYETFPLCFSREEPKPLKVRIEKDILAHYPEDASFARIHVRKALAVYTKWHKYRQALLTATHRYDLQGNPVSDLVPSIRSVPKYSLRMIKNATRNARKPGARKRKRG